MKGYICRKQAYEYPEHFGDEVYVHGIVDDRNGPGYCSECLKRMPSAPKEGERE